MAGGQQDEFSHVSVDPDTDGTAYAVGLNTGLYKTTSGGQSWSSINNGLSLLLSSGPVLGHITVNPVNPQNLYVSVFFYNSSSAEGIYKSADGGNIWTSANTPIPAGNLYPNLTMGLTRTSILYTAPIGIGEEVYVSTDAAAHWQPMTPFGLVTSPVQVMVTANAVDPNNLQNLYGAAWDGQIYIFTSLPPARYPHRRRNRFPSTQLRNLLQVEVVVANPTPLPLRCCCCWLPG